MFDYPIYSFLGLGYFPYIWAGLGLLLILIEFTAPGFVIFFFGVGALITAGLVAVFPSLSLSWQMVFWLVLSTATLFSMRRWLKGVFSGRERRGADEEVSIGEFAEVVEAISPSRPGRIRFKGTTWGAVSKKDAFGIGDYVQIIESNNITFVVEKKSNNDVV